MFIPRPSSTYTACTTMYYRFFNIWNKLLKCTYIHLSLFHSNLSNIQQRSPKSIAWELLIVCEVKDGCIWIKNQHIWRNEIFPIVLSIFGLYSATGISTLDFIQLQFSVNWTLPFQNFHSLFFGRNACPLCLKFIQTSYAMLYKAMKENGWI